MGRAQPKISPTDEHARRIAAAIAKGRLPEHTAGLDLYLESSPHEIFAVFQRAAHHMATAGGDQTLAFAYLFLLQGLLERLRYRSDRGYADAAALIADFQSEVARQVEAGQVAKRMLAYATGTLHQSKIPLSPELAALSERQLADADDDGLLPPDVRATLAAMFEVSGGDPFMVVEAFREFSHALPEETRAGLGASLVLSGVSEGRAAAVLFLLDPDPVVRRTVGEALAGIATLLSPTDVRRLIAIRNWRPEDERAEIDTLIHEVRAAGIDCAQWEAGGVETMLASGIDGAATQGFLLVSPAGRKRRLSSILTRDGIADAWSGPPQTRREIDAALAGSVVETPMLAVSRSYIDRVVSHHLAVTTADGKAPPPGLLQLAETIGGADWQPVPMDFGETLAGLMADIPEALRGSAGVDKVLRESSDLAGLEVIAQSWFEDGPEVEELVDGANRSNRTRLAGNLLRRITEPRRRGWAEVFLRTALWMREASHGGVSGWRELAIVAKAVADGHDLTEIGLMRDLAERTIAVFADDGRD